MIVIIGIRLKVRLEKEESCKRNYKYYVYIEKFEIFHET